MTCIDRIHLFSLCNVLCRGGLRSTLVYLGASLGDGESGVKVRTINTINSSAPVCRANIPPISHGQQPALPTAMIATSHTTCNANKVVHASNYRKPNLALLHKSPGFLGWKMSLIVVMTCISLESA